MASAAALKRLEDFLAEAFSEEELRRLLRYLPTGSNLLWSLPGGGSSLSHFVFELVHMLERQGLIDRAFFHSLRENRPRRIPEIEQIEQLMGTPPTQTSVSRSVGGALLLRSIESLAATGGQQSIVEGGELMTLHRPPVILLHAEDVDPLPLHRALVQIAPMEQDVLIVPLSEWSHTFLEEAGATFAVLLSPLVLFRGAEHGTLFSELLIRHRRKELRVVPVIVVRTPGWRDTALGRLPPLPTNGLPILEGNSDDGWAAVAARLVPPSKLLSPSPTGSMTIIESAPPPDRILPIDNIFQTTGVPEISFVAPAQLSEIRDRLRLSGQGLVVDGPSGVGKTTAVRHALTLRLEQSFDELCTSGAVQWLSSKDPDDVDLLRRTLNAGYRRLRGHLVVDDFHRLERSLQSRVADLMKLVADASTDKAKVVVIGINPVGSSLTRDFRDLGGRFATISMRRQPDQKIEELIIKGEQAANIQFTERSAFVGISSGSFSTAQLLCREAVRREGITETQTRRHTITSAPEGEILDRVHNVLGQRFRESLLEFVSYDVAPPPRGATLQLLWLLSHSPDNTVSIVGAKSRCPSFAAAFDWLAASNLSTLFARQAHLTELLFYNRDGAVLSVEDPQLDFYLRHLGWPALARDSGHLGLNWDAEYGFRIPTTPGPATEPGAPAIHRPRARDLPRSVLLHLSDLHLENQEQAALWYDQLRADLQSELHCRFLHGVLISGDLTQRASPTEFNAVQQFLTDIRVDFKLDPSRFVLVPGNHDLSWTAAKDAYTSRGREDAAGLEPGRFIDNGVDVEVRDEDKYRKRFANFSELYRAVCLDPYSLQYEDQATLHHMPEQKLLILGLNSAWHIDHHFKDRAEIHNLALARALRLAEATPVYEGCLRIALWHHPVQSPDPEKLRDTGFLERLAQAGFRFGLHGHIHRTETGLFRYDHSAEGRHLDILGAGTFGAPVREWQPGYPLQYQLLEIEGSRLTVHTRRREELNGAWKPDARWTSGPGSDPLPRYFIEL